MGASVLGGCGGSDEKATITILYRTASQNSTKVFQVLQQEFSQVGIKVKPLGVANADFYTKYLQEPNSGKKGDWDVAIAGWGPDWYGDAAASFFLPLFSGEPSFPPVGSNFGFYNSAAANELINKANTTADPDAAAKAWGEADKLVTSEAAIFPLTDPKTANYASKNITSKTYVASYQNYDPTSIVKKGKDSDTLNMLGVGDVDYMDPNISYYSAGYAAQRMWMRGLLSFDDRAGHTNDPEADLATEIPTQDNGGVSADGKTYTIHLKDGVKWNTSPAREITAEDVVRGVKRSCNPVQPFGGLPDYESLLQGFQKFCDDFGTNAGAEPTVASVKKAIDGPLSGVVAKDDKTVVFKLTHPASYFASMLTLDAFAPAPIESLEYLPASKESGESQIASGPYKIDKYTATKQMVLSPNPDWDPATDTIRKQNFKSIIINMTGQQESIQQQLQTGASNADMAFDTFPPATDVPALSQAGDPGLTVSPSTSSNPYVVFNTISPNNNGLMANVAFRQALCKAISRDAMIKVMGGEILNSPLTHILPKDIVGSVESDPFPFDPAKAKTEIADLLK